MPLTEPYLKISLIRLFNLTHENYEIEYRNYVLSLVEEADRELGNCSFYPNSFSSSGFFDLTIYEPTSKQENKTVLWMDSFHLFHNTRNVPLISLLVFATTLLWG